MRHLLSIFAILLAVCALAASLHYGLVFCTLGSALVLTALLAGEYRYWQSLCRQQALAEQENRQLHNAILENKRQLERMRQLTEDIETALVIITPRGHIEWSNQTARLMLGEDTALMPKNIMEAISEQRDETEGMALSATYIRTDGHPRIIVAMKDIHRQMERQKMEAWQQLIRVVTHEIRNSITPITTICQQIRQPACNMEPKDITTGIEVIERRCRSLMEFMESYRHLTRLKMPDKSVFPAHELLSDLAALHPRCTFTVEPDGLTLNADRGQLEQVLINLIRNAEEVGATQIQLKATPRGLTVKDNGHGMSPQVQKDIFTPFYTTKAGGSGTGLILCRQIILQHGGLITVESSEGEGTSFHITLP